MVSFSKFRSTQSNDKLKAKFDEQKPNHRTEDENYYTTKHVRGEDGNGRVILRFLPASPAPDTEEGIEPTPYVHLFSFAHQGPGGWYINNSRKNISGDEKDPAVDYNSSIFADQTLTKEEKMAKLVKRNQEYHYNIYIVNDYARPENNGKVFKFKSGNQIFQIIEKAMFPEFEDDPKIEVFDPFSGANFDLRVTTETIKGRDGSPVKVPTYKTSKFMTPSALCTEEEFDVIWQKQFPLQPLRSEENHEPYEKLVTQFDRMMGKSGSMEDALDNLGKAEPKKQGNQAEAKKEQTLSEQLNDEIPDHEPKQESAPAEEPKKQVKVEEPSDDLDDWFNDLAK